MKGTNYIDATGIQCDDFDKAMQKVYESFDYEGEQCSIVDHIDMYWKFIKVGQKDLPSYVIASENPDAVKDFSFEKTDISGCPCVLKVCEDGSVHTSITERYILVPCGMPLCVNVVLDNEKEIKE